MRVVTIEEDNHGLIGSAMTYADAVHFLVNNDQLDALTEIYCEDDEVYKTVIEDLGEDWLAVILNWSMEKFCEYFEECFYLDSVEVYEVVQSTSLTLHNGSIKIADTLRNVQENGSQYYNWLLFYLDVARTTFARRFRVGGWV